MQQAAASAFAALVAATALAASLRFGRLDRRLDRLQSPTQPAAADRAAVVVWPGRG